MTRSPFIVRVCYPTFVASISALGAIGLLQIWAPTKAEWLVKMMWSLAIVAAVSGLVLAAYRTVALGSRID